MLFHELNLNPSLVKALNEKGYKNPTEIQQKAIPVILQRQDVLATAQTGTGKTAAFTLPLLQLISEENNGVKQNLVHPRVLILTPTRELALQIADNIIKYKRFLQLKCTVIFGGVSQYQQALELKAGTDILIATPGRLKDLMDQKLLNLQQIKYFVLDEADRMLDSGFLPDVKRIVKTLPAKRQTLLFSATLPPEIQALSATLLHNPVRIAVQPVSSTSKKITQCVYHVEKDRKHDLLVNLLQDKKMDRVLVFTTMKHHADKISKNLSRSGILSEAIHGNKSQSQRQNALARFKSSKVRVLIATDIVARGIDIDDLTHVINYELPDVAETYVHRIGRTGRNGKSGVAISFCSAEEKEQLRDIQKLISEKIAVQSHINTQQAILN